MPESKESTGSAYLRSRKKQQREAKKQVMEMLTLIGQIAITMVVPIAACTLLGWWIAGKTGFRYASVIGFFVGVVAGYQSVYRIVKKYLKQTNESTETIE